MVNDNDFKFNNSKQFTQKLLNYFYQRLCLFLAIPIPKKDIPKLLIFRNRLVINCRATFDHDTNSVKFALSDYIDISDNADSKYKIPLIDIYHELIHVVQHKYTDYIYTDLIEGAADIFSYILTGQDGIDYTRETIALWYVSKHILDLNGIEFYIFIRDLITDRDAINKYFFKSQKFINILSKKYNGSIDYFMRSFKNDYYSEKYKPEFYKTLNRLHNLIFFKY